MTSLWTTPLTDAPSPFRIEPDDIKARLADYKDPPTLFVEISWGPSAIGLGPCLDLLERLALQERDR